MAASSVLQPAAAAAAWPRFLPSPRRSAAQAIRRMACGWEEIKKLQRSDSKILGSSGSSVKAATSSRPEAVSSSHNDQSSKHLFGSVSDAYTIISGYWIGPDMDDGCESQ
ncbi:Os07g0670100 [Oryza sativa Japonica Group]|uniref:Os07g0670100 protein n=1 Tax=Oryza sativa subsp. japonica TaxID=39947 RepID=C7J4P1_ORYSJ|nr:Os07g0670100 [Oryza sativa Japonica Group]|eukprot:NP_001175328.1 Os07g0670100 [Oryza sativa Japonica Group]